MTTTSASRTVQRHWCTESNALVDVIRRGLGFHTAGSAYPKTNSLINDAFAQFFIKSSINYGLLSWTILDIQVPIWQGKSISFSVGF
ncbi:MAG: hypothetical protein ACK4S6_04275 [Roseateles asaccharophilus]|uniref:Uncharacterized protein n=1 Tax=Roseateles asaccharophilus TaxID=582607 RepID=A0A4R6NBG5_9BURK|nr:hypothetical protein [Roseateles asaccharophilus]MDN3542998.1 hypothetical protein [Roseateles asaccharophilus]TDP13303.1 hypothetical protein DFR39_101778 [Roseateles asaccharophilus]